MLNFEGSRSTVIWHFTAELWQAFSSHTTKRMQHLKHCTSVTQSLPPTCGGIPSSLRIRARLKLLKSLEEWLQPKYNYQQSATPRSDLELHTSLGITAMIRRPRPYPLRKLSLRQRLTHRYTEPLHSAPPNTLSPHGARFVLKQPFASCRDSWYSDRMHATAHNRNTLPIAKTSTNT